MTKQYLEEMRARCEMATQGPWLNGKYSVNYPNGMPICTQFDSNKEHDKRFIAHSRQDIPALLDYVAALENAFMTTPGKCSSCANFGTGNCNKGLPHLCRGWQFDYDRFAGKERQ